MENKAIFQTTNQERLWHRNWNPDRIPIGRGAQLRLELHHRLGAVRVAAAQLQRLLQLRQRRRGAWKMQKTYGDPGENGRKLLVCLIYG